MQNCFARKTSPAAASLLIVRDRPSPAVPCTSLRHLMLETGGAADLGNMSLSSGPCSLGCPSPQAWTAKGKL